MVHFWCGAICHNLPLGLNGRRESGELRWLKGCRFGARDSDGPEESRFRSAKFGEKPNESICCFENVVPSGK